MIPDDPNPAALFDVSGGRALVSIGPLSTRRYCTYSCPFCYVHASSFESYPSLSPSSIVRWLRDIPEPLEIVYVSGDTDSFAPPRMGAGLDLLEELCELNVDLLFTTRALFTSEGLQRLDVVRQRLTAVGRLLFGCVSIAQLEQPRIEPKPIPTPAQRLEQLDKLKKLGLVSVLTIRPFLPVVPVEEYLSLVELGEGRVDAVLGSVWYTDKEGVIRRQVLGPDRAEGLAINFVPAQMDFDKNDDQWLMYSDKSKEDAIRQLCDAKGLPFFMRSGGLIEWARRSATTKRAV